MLFDYGNTNQDEKIEISGNLLPCDIVPSAFYISRDYQLRRMISSSATHFCAIAFEVFTKLRLELDLTSCELSFLKNDFPFEEESRLDLVRSGGVSNDDFVRRILRKGWKKKMLRIERKLKLDLYFISSQFELFFSFYEFWIFTRKKYFSDEVESRSVWHFHAAGAMWSSSSTSQIISNKKQEWKTSQNNFLYQFRFTGCDFTVKSLLIYSLIKQQNLVVAAVFGETLNELRVMWKEKKKKKARSKLSRARFDFAWHAFHTMKFDN